MEETHIFDNSKIVANFLSMIILVFQRVIIIKRQKLVMHLFIS